MQGGEESRVEKKNKTKKKKIERDRKSGLSTQRVHLREVEGKDDEGKKERRSCEQIETGMVDLQDHWGRGLLERAWGRGVVRRPG